jgi:hypothetical protein
MKNQPSRKRVNAGNGVAPLMQFNNPIQTKNMTTPYLRNSINPLLWRYGFFLIALVSLTVNNVVGGTFTSRSGLVISGHPTSTQLSAQESQEDASKAHEATIIVFDPPGAATVASPACGGVLWRDLLRHQCGGSDRLCEKSFGQFRTQKLRLLARICNTLILSECC